MSMCLFDISIIMYCISLTIDTCVYTIHVYLGPSHQRLPKGGGGGRGGGHRPPPSHQQHARAQPKVRKHLYRCQAK